LHPECKFTVLQLKREGSTSGLLQMKNKKTKLLLKKMQLGFKKNLNDATAGRGYRSTAYSNQ